MLDYSRALVALADGISPVTRLAAAGYLSRYRGVTLQTYSISLDVFFRWLVERSVEPLDARRPQIELFVRYLEEDRHLTPASIHHHITPIRGFYRFALIDDYIAKDPSVALHLPKIYRDAWREDWLTGQELRGLVAASRRSPYPSDQGIVALLALLGLRAAEVLNVQIEDYQETVTGHRVLRLTGKGNKPATLPLTVAILRMLDASADGRTEGPLLLRAHSSQRIYIGAPHSYTSMRRSLERLARTAGIARPITPHMCRRGFVTHGLDQGIAMRDMQIAARHEDPRTTARYDRGAQNLDRSAIHMISASIAGGA